jgi:hypothetical protein
VTDDEEQVRHDALVWLRTHGPATAGELVGCLGLEDAWTDRELYELLLDEEVDDPLGVLPLVDGRLCDLAALLDGMTLTHELTAEERRQGTVALEPHLAPLHILSPDGRTLPRAGDPDVEPLRFTEGAAGITGEQGWLPDTPVLVLSVVGGRVAVGGLEVVPALDERTAERLAATLEAVADRHRFSTDEVELLIEARARYPLLLATPQAPFGALLAAVGLAVTDRGVRPLDEVEEPDDDSLVEHLREDHDLDDGEVAAVVGVQRVVLEVENELLRRELDAWREATEDTGERDTEGSDDPPERDTAHEPVPSPPDLVAMAEGQLDLTSLVTIDLAAASQDLATALARIEPAIALVDDVVDQDPLAAACLLALLHQARPDSKDRTLRANVAWVRARALELVADDHTVAERELRRAVELDPTHGPATFELAGYLSDRGQAGAALGWLAGMEGPGVDDLVALLSPYVAPGPMSAGRNEPCPCGSGRKHKVCCAPRGGWPLRERMPWLMRKLMDFYASPAARDTVMEVARHTGMAVDGASGSYRDTAALNLALFEGGVIADMCDLRGTLLPADELALLRDWSQVRAGLYELVEVAADDTCTLLDLRSGEQHRFVDHSLADGLEVGAAVLAWLVPEVERSAPFYGAITVPDRGRVDLLDLLDQAPSAAALSVWLRDLFAPPQLATTAGDALVSIERSYTVPDGAAARAALADHLEADDADGRLVAFEERGGERWLKGSIEVTGDRLVVSTMSAPRAAWFTDLLERVVPDAELIEEQRLPLDELIDRDAVVEDADPDGEHRAGGGLDLDALAPEERGAIEAELEAFMTRHEDAWPDTPLAALEGASPREALGDPTRRDVVLRLLDDMQRTNDSWQGPGRGMDPQRLRALLGLT